MQLGSVLSEYPTLPARYIELRTKMSLNNSLHIIVIIASSRIDLAIIQIYIVDSGARALRAFESIQEGCRLMDSLSVC